VQTAEVAVIDPGHDYSSQRCLPTKKTRDRSRTHSEGVARQRSCLRLSSCVCRYFEQKFGHTLRACMAEMCARCDRIPPGAKSSPGCSCVDHGAQVA
jgi:hypothetical protein